MDSTKVLALRQNLQQFTGTDQYYRISTQVVLTDGTKYLAEQGACYWLMDLIVSYITQVSFATEDFVSIRLERKQSAATVTLDDGNGNVLASQHIEYTDFLLDEIKLYACRSELYWVVMLPSEY